MQEFKNSKMTYGLLSDRYTPRDDFLFPHIRYRKLIARRYSTRYKIIGYRQSCRSVMMHHLGILMVCYWLQGVPIVKFLLCMSTVSNNYSRALVVPSSRLRIWLTGRRLEEYMCCFVPYTLARWYRYLTCLRRLQQNPMLALVSTRYFDSKVCTMLQRRHRSTFTNVIYISCFDT